MDYRIYHAVNVWASHHAGFGHDVYELMNVCVVLLVLGAVGLWFLARPGGSDKWKLAAGGSLLSGALAFAVNQVIHALHDRPRPYEAHSGAWHPDSTATDASFPSDHSSAAYGIAWAVLLYDRTVGIVFVAIATIVAIARVVVGAHYPGDSLAGLVVGLVVAAAVVRFGRPLLRAVISVVERVTDPLVRPLWRRRRG